MSRGTPPSDDQELPVTGYLRNWNAGDADGAGRVVASLYSELHRMAFQLLRSAAAHSHRSRAAVRSGGAPGLGALDL